MAVTIQFKRGTGVPTSLSEGEVAFSTDLNRLYIGGSGGSTVEPVTSTDDWVAPVETVGSSPTVSPITAGARYIYDGGSPNGFSVGSANDIVEYNGTAWVAQTPAEGTATYNKATNEIYTFNGSSWSAIDAVVSLQDAYNNGNTITTDGTNAVSITGSGTGSLLDLTQNGAAAHMNFDAADPTTVSPDNVASGDFWFDGNDFHVYDGIVTNKILSTEPLNLGVDFNNHDITDGNGISVSTNDNMTGVPVLVGATLSGGTSAYSIGAINLGTVEEAVLESLNLSGATAAQVALFDNRSGATLTDSVVSVVDFDGTDFVPLMKLVGGGGSEISFDGRTNAEETTMLAVSPATVDEGDLWYNQTAQRFKYFDGTSAQIIPIETDITLQEAYDNATAAGNYKTITTDATNGIHIDGSAGPDDAVLKLSASAGPHLNFDTTDPTAPSPNNLATGDLWYNISNDFQYYNGTSILTFADLESVQTFSGDSTFSAGINMTSTTQDVYTIVTPTGGFNATTSLVNKEYVDSVAAGLDPKESVTVATTADVGGTYSATGGTGGTGSFTGIGDSFDGVTLTGTERLLIKDQTNANENGIYVRTGAGAYERAADQDGAPSNEVSGGNFTFVEQGNTYADTGWVVSSNGVLDLTASPQPNINWVQFSSAGVVNGGEGITQNGSNLDLDINALSNTATTLGATDEFAIHSINALSPDGIAKITYDDILDALAGNGLVKNTATLDISLNELTDTPPIDVAADSIAFLDATDNSTKRDTIADLMTAVAGTVTTTALSASSGVLSVNITNLNAETSIVTADELIFHDADGGDKNKITFGNFESSLTIANMVGGTQGSVLVTDGSPNAPTWLDGSAAADFSATTTALMGYRSGTDDIVWTTAIDGGAF